MKSVGLNRENFFQGIYQRENKEYQVKLPIFYYDNTSMTAIYTASTSRVRACLPFDVMHPVELYPGRCIVALSAFEYRSTDIGAYNEFSLAALITYGKKGLPGLSLADQMIRNELHIHILSLPVDSEVARRGGVELAGYPKFMADFEWHSDNHLLRCTVSVKDKSIIRIEGKKLPTSVGRMMHTIIYTRHRDCLLKANLYIDPQRFAQSFNRKSAAVEIGTGHELCDMLKSLRLSAHPLAYQFSPLSRAILFDSKNIMDI